MMVLESPKISRISSAPSFWNDGNLESGRMVNRDEEIDEDAILAYLDRRVIEVHSAKAVVYLR